MKEKTLHKDDKLSSGSESSTLILYNDDVNTFEHVIKSLVEVCGHDAVQAEQCAMIVHFKGRSTPRKGFNDILYFYKAMRIYIKKRALEGTNRTYLPLVLPAICFREGLALINRFFRLIFSRQS